MKNCIRSRMFTARGTSRVGHSSNFTVRKIAFPLKGKTDVALRIEITPLAHPDFRVITTLEHSETEELYLWLGMQLGVKKHAGVSERS